MVNNTAAISSLAVTLTAISGEKITRLEQCSEDAKHPVEIWKINLWSAAILNMATMLVAILKIYVHELGATVEKILYTKNLVEIR